MKRLFGELEEVLNSLKEEPDKIIVISNQAEFLQTMSEWWKDGMFATSGKRTELNFIAFIQTYYKVMQTRNPDKEMGFHRIKSVSRGEV